MQSTICSLVRLVAHPTCFKRILCVLPDIFEPKGISERVDERETGGMDDARVDVVGRFECVLLVSVSTPVLAYMCKREEWHLEADHRVDQCQGHVLWISVWSDYYQLPARNRPTPFDRMNGHEKTNEDTLPEREEQDAFDTEELGLGQYCVLDHTHGQGERASSPCSLQPKTSRGNWGSESLDLHSLETETDAEVVYNAHVGVPRGELELSFMVGPRGLEYGSRDDKYRLDLNIFWGQPVAIPTHAARHA